MSVQYSCGCLGVPFVDFCPKHGRPDAGFAGTPEHLQPSNLPASVSAAPPPSALPRYRLDSDVLTHDSAGKPTWLLKAGTEVYLAADVDAELDRRNRERNDAIGWERLAVPAMDRVKTLEAEVVRLTRALETVTSTKGDTP